MLTRAARAACMQHVLASLARLPADHGICVSNYTTEDDPQMQDKQLTRLIPFLAVLALGRRAGKFPDMSEELQRLNVNTTLENNGEDFERAVKKRHDELKAAGEFPVITRSGRVTMAGGSGGGGGTLWSRMGIGR